MYGSVVINTVSGNGTGMVNVALNRGLLSSWNKKLTKYLELTKPKVTLLNLLVGVTCFLLARYPAVDWLKLQFSQ